MLPGLHVAQQFGRLRMVNKSPGHIVATGQFHAAIIPAGGGPGHDQAVALGAGYQFRRWVHGQTPLECDPLLPGL